MTRSNLNYLETEAYGSIAMLHPDGTLMCRIGKRRADWYLDRNLAEKLDDNSIQLTFQPNGYGRHNELFFTEPRQNVCVVCGTESKLTKHHVVPEEYRKILPFELKAHNDHDIVLLCVYHHTEYEKKANHLKRDIFRQIGYDVSNMKRVNDHNTRIIRAKKILKAYSAGKNTRMPDYKLEEYQYNANMEFLEDDGWHALFHEHFDTKDKLKEFCVVWRKHFLEHASPKFMSPHWNVNYSGRL